MPTKKKADSEASKKPAKKPAAKRAAKPVVVKKAPKAAVVAEKPVTATPKALPTEAKKAKEGEKETRKATAPARPSGGSEKQKIRVIIRAFDHKIVDESTRTIIDAAERTGSLVTGAIPLPTRRELFTLNRATFVHKNDREQFEIKTHKRLIDITEYTPTTIEALSNLNLPAGVDVEIKML